MNQIESDIVKPRVLSLKNSIVEI